MKRHLIHTQLEKLKVVGFLCMLLTVFSTSAQVSTDLNPHIKATDPTETIVYTALKKGYVSIKAEVQLMDGKLWSLNGQSFEDVFLKPLLERTEQNNGRIYQDNNSDLFYLFIRIIGDERRALAELEKTLSNYEQMISGFDKNNQRNPLKVVLINTSPVLAEEILSRSSSLISLEGDYAHLDQSSHYTKMPVVGLNYDNLDFESLDEVVKTIHSNGKKLRLYNVPHDEAVWKSLITSGTDFINSKIKSQTFLTDTN
ncbi:MAG: hypothetical protein NXI20_03125 [bacterium]|nr:hypothetical protein [bacterium]